MRRTRSRRYNSSGGDDMWNSVSRTGSNVVNSISNSADQAGTGIQNFFSNGYNSIFKKKEEPWYDKQISIGGRRRSKKQMGGKYHPNIPSNNVATNAAPVNGIKTATPHHWVGSSQKWVGGRRTKRRRGGKKSKKRKMGFLF
jgi:hypothetical protein